METDRDGGEEGRGRPVKRLCVRTLADKNTKLGYHSRPKARKCKSNNSPLNKIFCLVSCSPSAKQILLPWDALAETKSAPDNNRRAKTEMRTAKMSRYFVRS